MYLNDKKIAIYGLGHIGLPTAAILASNDLEVIGADINPDNVDKINKGICSFKEPGLDELVKKVVENDKLKATTDLEEAARLADILIVIVPTPIDDKKNADLSYVISACKSISHGLNKGNLVIIESTVPPETGTNVVKDILEESGLICGKDFHLAYSPERALPNNTIYEMTHNTRIVGGYNQESADMASQLYSYITEGDIIIVKNMTSAEMVKLMENTYRDVNIALANEFALLCEKIDVDVNEVINSANYHPRVNIHTPGPGVGGHCIPVDPYFLIELGRKYDVKTRLLDASRAINNYMPEHVLELLLKYKTDKEDYSVGILGMAYKGNVDDIRESPSIDLIKLLESYDFDVYVNDPHVSSEIIESYDVESISYPDALKCDCVILMTDHDLYKDLKADMLPNKFIISTRPILDADEFRKEGINFQAIGNIYR
ncbi:MAG: UDP-N-acetyl-D-mannosaminuronic acid dehydrogenase [Methanosphaera sp. rholeuAM130]|nr:MAG: UDP-N-acetyl-D-mannosaminuronic acid dehydrogenase [Methanosphaera sp. rholeuAM130]